MLRPFYLKIEYLDDIKRPMIYFLSLSFRTENLWILICHFPYKDMSHNLFINCILLFFKYAHQQQPYKVFYCSKSHRFVAQKFREIFFMAQPYSLKHMKIDRAPQDYWSARSKFSAWPHTALTIDRYLCPRREYNPNSTKPEAAIPLLKPRDHRDRQFLWEYL